MPNLLQSCHVDGFEISDRELSSLTGIERVKLEILAADNYLELVLDINVNLTYQNTARRQLEISHALAQLKTAHRIGSHRVRICLGGQMLSIQKLLRQRSRGPDAAVVGFSTVKNGKSRPTLFPNTLFPYLAHSIRENIPAWVWKRDEKIDKAIESPKPIMKHAESLGIEVGIENHWGISSRSEWILDVIERVGSPFLGTCPDFGNWPRSVSPDAGVAQLAPHAFLAHIKSIHPHHDVSRQFESIVRKVDMLLNQGFNGPFTSEYEGTGDSWESVALTARMLRRHYG